ncbi:hypothetical protein ARMGADRAFT_1159262 [Armillaria gallica]|uniref:Uncharacterized protein n=1 Tax=Armillaria gallica TaxID=47427 RepID=A0A2H3EQ63_ARMGA|nr:hypothetical protein ARMGADRAFT_1159262 [Armillaria gallica]
MAPNLFNLTVPDQSPTFIYSPYREGDLNSSWKVYYSNSPDSSYDSSHNSSNLASGQSLHSTTLQGASLEISFMGTAIYLNGSGTAGAYSTTLDGGDAVNGSPADAYLVSHDGLDYEAHTLVLNTTSTSQLNVTSATVTVGIGNEGATITDTNHSAVNVANGISTSVDPFFTTNGQYNTDHDAQNYSRIDTTGAGSKFSFSFSSASAVFVYGTANYDHGAFSVTLSPAAGVSTSTRTLNSTSKWFAQGSLTYWETGLDRDKTYLVTFENLVEGKYFDIHQVQLRDGVPASTSSSSTSTASNSGSSGPSSSSSAHTLSTGAIIGVTAGTVVAIAAAFFFLFLWCRQRRENKARYNATLLTDLRDPAKSPGYPSHQQFQPLLSGHVEPFVMPPASSATRRHHSKNNTVTSTDSSVFTDAARTTSLNQMPSTSRLVNHLTEDGMMAFGSESAGSSSGTESKTTTAPPPERRNRPVRQETDAGPVLVQDHEPQEDVLPPGYNPAWSSGAGR